ncbi:hypothetical protein HL742_000232 [Campylobacter upsaliensis]|nr:hypothetical protein [Campylobacter upsaliensis]
MLFDAAKRPCFAVSHDLSPTLTLPPPRPRLFFATLKLNHASHEPSLQRPCQCQIHALKPHLSAHKRAVFKLVFSFYGA